MATFNDLYNFVMSDIRGVEPELIDFHIRNTVRDWLGATTQWRELLTLVTTPGMTSYALTPRAGGQVAGILRFGDVESSFDLPCADEGHRRLIQVTTPAKPCAWRQVYPGVIEFQGVPDAAYTFQLEVYKRLTLDPTDDMIPDDVFDTHAEDLSYGVKARLQAMTAKPWTDPTMATVNNTLYTKAKFATRARVRSGGQLGNSRVSAPSFTARRPR